MTSPVFVVDVAHPPRSHKQIASDLAHAWDRVRTSPSQRVLKIVHGYGSSGKGGSSRTEARNWAFHHRRHFRAIIEGERYSLFDSDTQQLVRELGDYQDADRGAENPGILVIWVK